MDGSIWRRAGTDEAGNALSQRRSEATTNAARVSLSAAAQFAFDDTEDATLLSEMKMRCGLGM
jgi:hypothetical protein